MSKQAIADSRIISFYTFLFLMYHIPATLRGYDIPPKRIFNFEILFIEY